MKSLHIKTPLIESQIISKKAGLRVFLKLENVQPTGSFKIRGIGHLCLKAKEDGVKHFVSSSGGNAGYAVAYAGRKLGVATTVLVPNTTNQAIIEKIEDQEAEVKRIGEVWDETHRHALEFAREVDGLCISPFDHPLIWEGHSTIIDEIVGEIDKPDAVIVSVGGGGLLCGILEGLNRNLWHDVPVISVETEGTKSFAESIRAGKLVTLEKITGLAKSLGAKTVTQKALDWSKQHPIKPYVISDQEAVSACISFAEDHRYLVEPACGASLAIPYTQSAVLKNMESVVVVVCGGIDVNANTLVFWEKELANIVN